MKDIILNILILIVNLIYVCSSICDGKSTDCLITGKVFNIDTREPVSDANVYIAYTLIGSSTNNFGRYTIENVDPGQYFLVVSHVGYKDSYIHFRISKGDRIKYNFYLLPKIYQAEPITVLGDSSDWKKNLKRFLKEFLGTLKNSKITSIINEKILDFSLVADTLFASAPVPLVIINRSLGYKIEYSLYHFESTYNFVKYTGFPKITKIESDKPEIKDAWEVNRKNTYEGSLRHFLNVICLNYDLTAGKTGSVEFEIDFSDRTVEGYLQKYKNDDFAKISGFEVLSKSALQNNTGINPIIQLVNTNHYLKPAENENEMYFMFDKYLEIRYKNPNKIRNIFKDKKQISWMSLEKDSVLIDKKGRYYETFSIKTSGFWGLERISDILPFEYIYKDSSVFYNIE